MQNGTQVTYSYRQHQLLGGLVVSGAGSIIGRTVVGRDDAYIIKPADGSDCVHVRVSGVRAA